MQVQPYLFYNGRCEEALAFYKNALGIEVDMLMRYSDSPDPIPPGMIPPGNEHKVMHASFRLGDSVLMASDGQCNSDTGFKGFSLSISAPDQAAAERMFSALAEGGQVQMPLQKTFYSPCFGMVADKFGVGWMVIVNA